MNFTDSRTDKHLALFTFCASLYLCMVIMYGHVCSCVVMCGHVWSCVVMYGHVWSCKLMYHVWSILVMYDKYNQVWSCVVKYIYAWSCMEMHSCIRSCMVNGHVWCWVKYGLVWSSCKGRGKKKVMENPLRRVGGVGTGLIFQA